MVKYSNNDLKLLNKKMCKVVLAITVESRKSTIAWIAMVLILSFGAYFPMLLEQSGYSIPSGLLFVKYLFVCIPLLVTIGTTIHMKTFKAYYKNLFKGRIKTEYLTICFICILVGVVTSSLFSKTDNKSFLSYYDSVLALIFSSIYLLCTAVIEEAAWRGFLLEQLSTKRKCFPTFFYAALYGQSGTCRCGSLGTHRI